MATPTPTPDRLQVGAEELIIRVASTDTGGALFAAEVRMAPGGGPPRLHRHPPSELYHVLAGELAFYIADDAGTVHRTLATAGAVVPIRGGRAHTIRNESAAEARALAVYVPGELIERFARAAAALAREGTPSVDDVLELATRHGIEMIGPIPPVRAEASCHTESYA
jgi:oxalate decarboxylase/phosphoglucose isomerase-like protein (cupin superfamily)